MRSCDDDEGKKGEEGKKKKQNPKMRDAGKDDMSVKPNEGVSAANGYDVCFPFECVCVCPYFKHTGESGFVHPYVLPASRTSAASKMAPLCLLA